jgi:hypothetical protein
MYELSRAIYRRVSDDVIPGPTRAETAARRARMLVRCEDTLARTPFDLYVSTDRIAHQSG